MGLKSIVPPLQGLGIGLALLTQAFSLGFVIFAPLGLKGLGFVRSRSDSGFCYSAPWGSKA